MAGQHHLVDVLKNYQSQTVILFVVLGFSQLWDFSPRPSGGPVTIRNTCPPIRSAQMLPVFREPNPGTSNKAGKQTLPKKVALSSKPLPGSAMSPGASDKASLP